ncbi:hypothetical protein PsAD5_00718 [Pseudovibrio sp. Ad5]|nr:hypothetical protein PsAD5_00718 [Pseudovibrio sp. Ad5]
MLEYFYIFSFNGYNFLTVNCAHLGFNVLSCPLLSTILVVNRAMSPRLLMIVAVSQLLLFALMTYLSGGQSGIFAVPDTYFHIAWAIFPILCLITILWGLIMMFLKDVPKLTRPQAIFYYIFSLLLTCANPLGPLLAFTTGVDGFLYHDVTSAFVSTLGAVFAAFALVTFLPASAGAIIYSYPNPLVRRGLMTASLLAWSAFSLWILDHSLQYFNIRSVKLVASIF